VIKFQGLYKVLDRFIRFNSYWICCWFYRFTDHLFLAKNTTPRINALFRNGQIFTAVGLAFSHGTNDAQKQWVSLH
jgi:phosphate/sulfate permease